MLVKTISSGFDTKCEDCGNYYSASYIELHKKERCFKKPFNINSYPMLHKELKKLKKVNKNNPVNKTQEIKIKNPVKQVVPKQVNSPSLKTAALNQIIPVVSKIKHKNNALVPCKLCNAKLKASNLDTHLNKCPVLKINQIIEKKSEKKPKNNNSGVQLSACQYCCIKVKAKNLKSHISTFHPSVNVKPRKNHRSVGNISCSDCGAKYSAVGIKCPQCSSYSSRIKPLAEIKKLYKCRQCGKESMTATSNCYFCGDK